MSESQYAPYPLTLHVAFDYALVAIGFASPWFLRFSEYEGATQYALALAAFGLLLNVLTAYPGGLWKLLPFRWHRFVELTSPPAFMMVPWLFFAEAGAMPWAFTCIGAAIFVNATLTRT